MFKRMNPTIREKIRVWVDGRGGSDAPWEEGRAESGTRVPTRSFPPLTTPIPSLAAEQQFGRSQCSPSGRSWWGGSYVGAREAIGLSCWLLTHVFQHRCFECRLAISHTCLGRINE